MTPPPAGQLSKLEKMYHSLKDCKMHLLEYTRVHQESCPWFLLLPSDDVLQFICHGSDPIFLSANINKILPPAESLLLSECAEEVTVSGIVSRDGDTLALLEVCILWFCWPAHAFSILAVYAYLTVWRV